MTRDPAPGGQITARSGSVRAYCDPLTGFELQESFAQLHHQAATAEMACVPVRYCFIVHFTFHAAWFPYESQWVDFLDRQKSRRGTR